MKLPRFGWIVGGTAAGALLALLVNLALSYQWRDVFVYESYSDHRLAHHTARMLWGGTIGACLAVLVEAVVYRFRFGIDQLLELCIVCALLMFL